MLHWFHKAIIYHIFIDRYFGDQALLHSASPKFCGGNISGINNKLEHIKKLGVNTIWLSPFYSTNAYHGYHITDYTSVDHRFGSKTDLKNLIASCKKNDMRIIADVVPNHCSVLHPWFIDAKLKSSAYRSWFHFDETTQKHLDFMGYSEIAKINLENTETAEWMLNNLCEWAKLGFDGFRIDHVLGIPDAFLKELNKRLKTINPEFVLLGEAWGEGMQYKYLKTLKLKGKHKLWQNGFKQIELQKHYEGILDGVLDFGWRNLLLDNLEKIKTKSGSFSKTSLCYSQKYASNFFLPRFLDNHDTSRIMHVCNNDHKLFFNLLKILFSQEQPLIIYYGTEAGLTHNNEVNSTEDFSDIQARGFIDWTKTEQTFYTSIRALAFERRKRY